MTLEDPFYVVKDEVFGALNKTRGLYLRWQEISRAPVAPNSPELEWTSTELRNSLRSIEWDLEDLEDTISIVERNPLKFKIDHKQICERQSFIQATKQEVTLMKSKMSLNRNRDKDDTAREPLLAEETPVYFTPVKSWTSTPKYTKYSKLANQTDSPCRSSEYYDARENSALATQEKMLNSQNDQLQVIGNSVDSLKTVSRQINIELGDQSLMLDDLNAELENTDSKIDSSLKKVAKILRMNNSRRQWLVIGTLIFLLFIVLVLFVIL